MIYRLLKLHAYLSEFFGKSVHEIRQYFASIVDLLCVFPNNPDKRCSRIRLIQFVYTLAERRYYALITWVLSENVFDDHDGFLDDIVDLCVDEVKQCVDTLLA